MFQAQVPKQKYVDEIDPYSGWRKLVLKVKPSRTLKKVLLSILPQSLHKNFNQWYYDDKTSEAVIVLGSGSKLEFI